MISEVISIRTWTSIASVATATLVFLAPASAQILDSGPEPASADSQLEIPEYSSTEEIVFELVVPFLILFFLNRLALQQALVLILGEPGPRSDDPDEGEINRYATILALTLVSSLIPTSLWGIITGISNVIASLPLIIISLVTLYLGYVILRP
jgi:hypothetical protein